MEVQKGKWITLDSLVNEYIDRSEQSIHKYFKLWNIAFSAMDDLGIDFFYEVKTIKIPLNANGTATLPPYINWIKVGVFDFFGQFIPLEHNNKLSTYASLFNNRKSQNSETVLNNLDTIYSIGSPCFYNYYGGGYLYGSSWFGGGTFNVDERNGVIVFDNWANISEVVVELMCAPEKGEEYYVPLVFKEAIINFIGWQDIEFIPSSRKGSLGDKDRRKHNYYNSRRLAQSRFKPFNLEQAALT